jgi:hypothetical protein
MGAHWGNQISHYVSAKENRKDVDCEEAFVLALPASSIGCGPWHLDSGASMHSVFS